MTDLHTNQSVTIHYYPQGDWPMSRVLYVSEQDRYCVVVNLGPFASVLSESPTDLRELAHLLEHAADELDTAKAEAAS